MNLVSLCHLERKKPKAASPDLLIYLDPVPLHFDWFFCEIYAEHVVLSQSSAIILRELYDCNEVVIFSQKKKKETWEQPNSIILKSHLGLVQGHALLLDN